VASRFVGGAAALAFVLAGCGGAKHADADPNAPKLITQSLERARAQPGVRFHADLTLGAKLGDSNVSTGFPRERLQELAGNPFHLTLDGVRSDKALVADGTLEASGSVHPFRVLQDGDHLFLRLEDTWYRLPGTIGRVFSIESFAGLIPQEACVNHGRSEGCDEVDFGPALERGHIGGSIMGAVERKPDETVITGTVDAAGFAAFQTNTTPQRKDTRGIYDGAVEALRPYEQAGHVELTIDKDGLPRRFVLSYHLDHDALVRHMRAAPAPVDEREARLEIDLSDWGTAVHAVVPEAASLPRAQYGRLVEGLYLARYLFV
jgi:hypothetical protein